MVTDDEVRFRQYLLGELSDEQSAALEEEYFAQDAALDRVWAAENELIDGYLSDRLSRADRERFDRHYLAAPHHRSRVAIARELRRAAAEHGLATSRDPGDRARWTSFGKALSAWPVGFKAAAAAALLLIAIGGAWLVRPRSGSSPVSQSPVQPREDAVRREPARPSRVVLAVTLSPAGVRGADEASSVTISPGADVVILHLERDAAGPLLTAEHAAVRRVSGAEVWRGPAASERGTGPTALARIEVPVSALPRDDYVVTLFGTEANGRELERYQYFLRIR